MKKQSLITITTLYLSLLSVANAVTITVTADHGLVAVDGVCSISEAIIAANTDTSLNECIAGAGDDRIELTKDIVMSQAYENDATFGATGTPPISTKMTLDGQGFILQRDNSVTCTVNGTPETKEFRILRTTTTADLFLQNITIAEGCSDNINPIIFHGGGIYHEGILTIDKTTFKHNKARSNGGAFFNFRGTITTITNSLFTENSAGEGGAISTLTVPNNFDLIENSTFSNNSARGNGGAIYILSSINTIQNCTFSGNTTTASVGAAIYKDDIVRLNNFKNNLFHNHNGWFECFIRSGVIASNNLSDNSASRGCPGTTKNLDPLTVAPLADNGGPTMTHALLAGSQALNMGNTTATTSDQRGFAADGIRDIGAFEAQIPVITAPADIILEATAATTPVNLGTATVTDVDEAGLTGIADMSSPFVVGVYTVTWNVSDSQGHMGVDTQSVTITDTTAPTITAPADIVIEATGALTAVTLGMATATDLVDGNIAVVTADMSSPFSVGTHTITWSATDIAGNTGSATQTVTITDTTAPTITAPADIVIEATGALTAVILGIATATDLVDGNITPVSADMSNPFSLAMHNITWSATDNAGNTGTATQLVNVQAVISGIVNGLNGSLTLQNNDGDDVVITVNGGFRFATALDNLSNYNVSIASQPNNQFCVLSNDSGQVSGNNVSDLTVNCTDNTVSLDSTLLDFGFVFVSEKGSQTVTLSNTGLGDVIIDSFSNPISPFSISGGSCVAVPVILITNQSCDFIIQYRPVSEGSFTGSFLVNSNTNNSPNNITLAGSSAIRIIPIFSSFGLILLLLLFVTTATQYIKSTHRDVS